MKTLRHWRRKLKKLPEDGKTSLAHGSIDSILWKWPCYQNQPTESIQSPPKFQRNFSQKLKNILNFIQKDTQKHRITPRILNNERAAGSITILGFRAIIIKPEWYYWKNKHIGWWNRTEDLAIRHIPMAIWFFIETKNTYWRRQHFQQVVKDKPGGYM